MLFRICLTVSVIAAAAIAAIAGFGLLDDNKLAAVGLFIAAGLLLLMGIGSWFWSNEARPVKGIHF